MKVNKEWLMRPEEGREWNAFKAELGPIYPGYESFETYMQWTKERFKEYGCVDFLEHHWTFNTYRVNDWPNHDSGVLGLTIEGKEYPVGTFLMLAASTGEEGVSGEMVFYDDAEEPLPNQFKDRIVVMPVPSMKDAVRNEKFMESYVVTDTNYRTGPEIPAPMYELVDPEVNNSWKTRWDFFSWMKLNEYAKTGGAKALIVLSDLTYGCLEGLYDRQRFRGIPAIVVDRVTGKEVRTAAEQGKTAAVKLISEFFDTDTHNYFCFLPGKHYGQPDDEYVSINCHVDAMSLTQDNGSLGALGIARYFSHIPQEERRKTLVFCIDSRHFIEGFEFGNFKDDPYQVFPDVAEKTTVTVGLEHMGEMEAAEDYANNTMVPTGRPEFSFMKADDNDFCARILIEAAKDSGLERADIKIDHREGIHGQYKGMVRAVQASCHRLNTCVIGLAGNWPGAHTQTFSGMQYFGEKKFRDEVHLWTQVVGNLMEVDSIVYDICWSDLNKAIRELYKDVKLKKSQEEALLDQVRLVFREVENGEFETALHFLETNVETVFEEWVEKAHEDAWKALEHVKTKLSACVNA